MMHEEVVEILKKSEEAVDILRLRTDEDGERALLAIEGLRDVAHEFYSKFYELKKISMDYELRRLRKFFLEIKEVIDGISSKPIDKIAHECIVDMTCSQEANKNDN